MWTAAVISRGFDLVFLMDKLELLAFRLHILHLSGVSPTYLARRSLCEEIGKDAEQNFRINQL